MPTADVAITDSTVEVTSGLYDTEDGIKLKVAGDTYPRLHLTPQGTIKFGDGTVTPETQPSTFTVYQVSRILSPDTVADFLEEPSLIPVGIRVFAFDGDDYVLADGTSDGVTPSAVAVAARQPNDGDLVFAQQYAQTALNGAGYLAPIDECFFYVSSGVASQLTALSYKAVALEADGTLFPGNVATVDATADDIDITLIENADLPGIGGLPIVIRRVDTSSNVVTIVGDVGSDTDPTIPPGATVSIASTPTGYVWAKAVTPALGVSYDNTGTDLTADDVQAAISELDTRVSALEL